MTQSTSGGTHNQNRQSGSPETQADVDSAAGKKDDKSSHDEKSRIKAGKDEGAGGGAKQKQNH